MNNEKKGYKYLAKNVGLLTIGQFGSKLLTFFLVPLYTNVLTTEEYGTYDVFNTTISLLIPILTLNILEAVVRFTIDKDTDKSIVFSYSLKVLLMGFCALLAFITANSIFGWIEILKQYAIYFMLSYLLSALSGILVAFARGIDHVKDVSISGVISTFVLVLLNILFLLVFKIGLDGYFLAHILGIGAQCIYLSISIKPLAYIKFYKNTPENKSVQKKLTNYSIPMIANSIGWWINNASDRYIVIWMCGVAANGIYSVGYKIPSILSIIQLIFNQAWILSAVKDFDPEDKNGFFSKLYSTYGFVMVFLCSGIIMFDRLLASFLYAKDFYEAWKYVPFLLISIIFGALSGFIGGIFSAVKNSKIYAQSTIIGAICNVILNIIFIHFWGPIGAAIATAISFWIVFVIRVFHMKNLIKIKIHTLRDYTSYFVLIIQSLALLFIKQAILMYSLQFACILVIVLLYISEVKGILKKAKILK